MHLAFLKLYLPRYLSRCGNACAGDASLQHITQVALVPFCLSCTQASKNPVPHCQRPRDLLGSASPSPEGLPVPAGFIYVEGENGNTVSLCWFPWLDIIFLFTCRPSDPSHFHCMLLQLSVSLTSQKNNSKRNLSCLPSVCLMLLFRYLAVLLFTKTI